MPTVKVHNLKNKEVGSVELSDAVFDVELNEHLIHSAVKNYLQNKRQGTSATKTRGNVRGGGKKPWKQKGTGRARVASIRSPLWKGGGRVHGPQPRDWSTKFPKKMKRGALRSALSERLREENVIIIDDFTIENSKTKSFIEVLTTLGLKEDKKHKKTLIVDSLDNENLILSSRNIQKVKVINSYGLNVYDLLYHEKLVLSKSAVEELNGWLDPTGENDAKPAEPKAKKKAKKTEEVSEEKTEDKKPKKEAKRVDEVSEEKAAEETVEKESVKKAKKAEEVSEETTEQKKPAKKAKAEKEEIAETAEVEGTPVEATKVENAEAETSAEETKVEETEKKKPAKKTKAKKEEAAEVEETPVETTEVENAEAVETEETKAEEAEETEEKEAK